MANLDTQMRELQIAVIIIKFQRANTRSVGLLERGAFLSVYGDSECACV